MNIGLTVETLQLRRTYKKHMVQAQCQIIVECLEPNRPYAVSNSITADGQSNLTQGRTAATMHELLSRVRQYAPPCSREGTRFAKYLTTLLRLSYDNAKVTIDLR